MLQRTSWSVDLKEGRRQALKFRWDARIVVVIREYHGCFETLSLSKCDVFDLAEHVRSNDFAAAYVYAISLFNFMFRVRLHCDENVDPRESPRSSIDGGILELSGPMFRLGVS